MATYSAYRHVELDNVGSGKKRILKPPGGGSSDIFNTNDMSGDNPRRVKNYMKSSIFDENGASPTLPSAGTPSTRAGSHYSPSNIFAEANSEPHQPRKVKNYMKSNIFGDMTYENGEKKQENGNYNPITGEANETNGVSDGKESVQPCIRIRNPPGGPSTKLW